MLVYYVGFLCASILSGIAIVLLNQLFREPSLHRTRKKLSLFLVIHIFSDLSWILFLLLDNSVLPRIFFYQTIFRIIWSVAFIEYGLILLPFYELVHTKKYIKKITFFLMITASLFQIIVCNSDFIGMQFLNPYFFTVEQPLLLFCVVLCELFYCFSIQHSIILQHQSRTVIYLASLFLFLACAQLLSTYHIFPFSLVSKITFALLASYALIFAVLITAWKLKQLRFLNCTNKVKAGERIRSQAVLRCALEVTEKIQTKNEFLELAKRFFADGFAIYESRVSLYLSPQPITLYTGQITPECSELLSFAQCEGGIFSYDELIISSADAASAPIVKKTVELLEQINALFLIPIIHKNVLIGEIIVTRKAREARLFSAEAQNSMAIFASALGLSLSLLRMNHLYIESARTAEYAIREKEKAQAAQQQASQHLLQCGKLLQTVLTLPSSIVAVIEYERSGARSMNREAVALFSKYPAFGTCSVTQVMQKAAENSILYRQSITMYATRKDGMLFEIEAVPQRSKTALLTVRCIPIQHETMRALVHEFMCMEYEGLKRLSPLIPLIEQLITVHTQELIFLKASLFYTLLHKKPIVLQGSQMIVEFFITQLIRLFFPEKRAFIIDGLQRYTNQNEYAQLFGVIDSFKKGVLEQQSVLKQAQKDGVLCIKNVDKLEYAIQESIAQLCVFNTYTPLYGAQPEQNGASLIVTFHDDPILAYTAGKIHPALFAGLSKLTIVIPNSYNTFTLRKETTDNLFVGERLFARFDPFLAHVQKCGKQVLRDPELLCALWDRYKDYGEIATILNVHRTTVYRACVRLNIGEIAKKSAHC